MDGEAPPGYAADALEVVLEHVGDDGVPVLAHVPVGHETSSFPVPLGVDVILDEDGLTVVDPEGSP
jgi:muramoyltetrapeptide carboxypeptidase LdcA involved in peptidoglycan recycling